MLVMNISYQWDMDALLDFANSEGVFFFGYRHPHDFTPDIFETMYLSNCAFDVTCVSSAHGLDNDRRVTTDSHIADMNLSRFSSHDKAPLMDDVTDIKVGDDNH